MTQFLYIHYRWCDTDECESIIAIHGLNGDRFRTWTEPKSKKLWLRDFLPKDLPRGRILTFGYNATAAFENSVADIVDHGRELLGSLVERREEKDVSVDVFGALNVYLAILLDAMF